MIRFAFDSNILVYLAGGERSEADRQKIMKTRALLVRLLPIATLVAPVQSMGEALRVLAQKLGKTDRELQQAIDQWQSNFEAVPTTLAMLIEAMGIVSRHHLQHWDSVILSAARSSDCTILLSEDMQDGFIWRGLTIINPFAEQMHPVLASLLE